MATCRRCCVPTRVYSCGIPMCRACLNVAVAKAEPTPHEVHLTLPPE